MDTAGIDASSWDGSSSLPLSLASPYLREGCGRKRETSLLTFPGHPHPLIKRAIKQNILLEWCDVTEIKGL